MNTTTTKIAGEAMTDKFNGDNAKLVSAITALLDLDATGSLVPHGVGGHARTMLEAAAARLSSGGCTATEQIRALFQPWPEGECGPTDEPESQYRFGYNTAIEDALEALSTAPAQSCEQAEFGTARERFISGAPVQASEHVLELARQALAARDSDTRTDDEKIAAAVDFICDTRLDQPVKCGDAEQADEAVTDATERMKALWGVLMCQVVETSSESYLSLRCVGMPPTDDEFALAVNRAIDAARAKDSK